VSAVSRPGRPAKECLVDRPDQILDLLGVRAEFLGELVEIGDRRIAVKPDLSTSVTTFTPIAFSLSCD